MSQIWKTIPLFISSTFRDFHAERDHLRYFVLPRLEEELSKRRHHLEWIDLRHGVESDEVETDEQRELTVLKVCLAEIKRSRPYLIVLLGDRYGWVPPGDHMEAATREAGFQSSVKGKSITALEIEFGMLKDNPDQKRHCFVYLREPLPYEKIPPNMRADYSEQFATDDQAAARHMALDELRARLTSNSEIKPHTYKADWDAKQQSVSGLEDWGNKVIDDLWKALDAETCNYAETIATTWERTESAALGEFIEMCSRNFTGRTKTIQQLLALAHSPAVEGTAWGACITGPPGSGKSALFAELHNKLESDTNILLLANAAGATMRGSNMDSVLRRWIVELVAFLKVNNPLPEKAAGEEMNRVFASLLKIAVENKRVVILLDALDQFEPTPRAKHLTWRPKPWPSNARLIATTLPGAEAESLSQWAGVEEVELPPLNQDDAKQIANKIWKFRHVPWSDTVWQTLMEKKLSDGNTATSNPLWTTLACEQLALLDVDDFTRADRQFVVECDSQVRLTQLRCHLAERMPPDVPGLYEWVLAHTEKVHGTVSVRSFTVGIALSHHGWRESDLRGSKDLQGIVPRISGVLFPHNRVANISPLKLAELRRAFRAHLVKRGIEDQLDFHHSQMREAVQKQASMDEKRRQQAHACISDLLEKLPPDDTVVCAERMRQLIGERNPRRAARYYASLATPPYIQGEDRTNADWTLVQWIVAGEAACGRNSAPRENDNLEWILSWLEEATLGPKVLHGVGNAFQYCLLDRLKNHACLEAQHVIIQRTNELFEKLVANHPDDPEGQCSLGESYRRLGKIQQTQGHFDDAFNSLNRGLEIARNLSIKYPEHVPYKRILSVSLDMLGGLLMERGDKNGAGKYFEECRESLKRQQSKDSDYPALEHDVFQNSIRLGDQQLAQQNLVGARDYYEHAHQIADRLLAANPKSDVWENAFTLNLERLGDLHLAQRDLFGARDCFTLVHQIVHRRATDDPDNVECQRDLAGSLHRIGAIAALSGHRSEAIQHFAACHSVLKSIKINGVYWDEGIAMLMEQLEEASKEGYSPLIELVVGKPSYSFAPAPPPPKVRIPDPLPRSHWQSSLQELRESAMRCFQKGLWEAAAWSLDQLIARGEPLTEHAPMLITCLLNAHDPPLDFDMKRIETMLQQLEKAEHANLAASFRQQLQAKFPSSSKKWWKIL